MAKHYNKKTLVRILQETAAVLGRRPEPEDMIEPSSDVFIAYFKKWDKAIKSAGLRSKRVEPVEKPDEAKAQKEQPKTVKPEAVQKPEKMEAPVQKAAPGMEEAPVKPKTTADAPVAAAVSVEEAAKPALKKTPAEEEDLVPANRRRYSKSIITQMLLDEVKRLGKKPTRKEIDANKNLPTVSTCLNYFGTTRIGDIWDEILEDKEI